MAPGLFVMRNRRLAAGAGAVILVVGGIACGRFASPFAWLPWLLGFCCGVLLQRTLGAARTGAYLHR